MPVGSQAAELLDAGANDEDEGLLFSTLFDDDSRDDAADDTGLAAEELPATLRTEADYQPRAAEIYGDYRAGFQRRFKWIRPSLFMKKLADDLRADNNALLKILADSLRARAFAPTND